MMQTKTGSASASSRATGDLVDGVFNRGCVEQELVFLGYGRHDKLCCSRGSKFDSDAST